MEIGKEVFEFKEKAYFPDSDEIKEVDLKEDMRPALLLKKTGFLPLVMPVHQKGCPIAMMLAIC